MALTEKDLKAIENRLEIKIDKALEERLRHLPTREELLGQLDQILTEIKASRDEQSVQAHHLRDHEDRLQALENK